MSRTRKRALMGFVAGALQGFQTALAQQAAQQREERLQAIRAQERAEDRQFTIEQFERQQEALSAREAREAERRAAERAEDRAFQTETRAADREFQAEQARLQRAAQERIAGMRPEPREQPVSVIEYDENGNPRTRFVYPSKVIAESGGYVGGLPASAAAAMQNAETNRLKAEQGGTGANAAPFYLRGTGNNQGQNGAVTPHFVFDPKRGLLPSQR